MRDLCKISVFLLLAAGILIAGCTTSNPAPAPSTNTPANTVAPASPTATVKVIDVQGPGGKSVHVESGPDSNVVHVNIPATGSEGPKVIDINIQK